MIAGIHFSQEIFAIDVLTALRTTVPLVSDIRISLRFWYHASLCTCCQNLEKNLGESGGQTFKDLTEKSVSFSTLATSSIRLLLFFGEEDQ